MKLRLEHCKNVDLMYGQGNGSGYWSDPVDKRLIMLEVASIAEASKAIEAWRDRNGLGGGNMAKRCGEITIGDRVVAEASYNGRVWTPYDHSSMEEWREKSELVVTK